MKTRNSILLMLILLLCTPLGSTGRFTDAHRRLISWEKAYISVTVTSTIEVSPVGNPVDSYTGSGTSLNRARMETYRHARQEAIERLSAFVRTLRVDGEQTVGDVIGENDSARSRLSESLMHFVKFRQHPSDYFSSSCEAKLSFGDILASLPFDFPEREFPVRDDAKISTNYTGLVIDARGLPVFPMLYPSVYNDNGLEIYGRAFVSRDSAGRAGLATYCRNEDEAMKHLKAGRKPYYTTAIRSLRGNPVISDRDARRILSASVTKEHLKKCGVIIIINMKDARETGTKKI